MSVCPAMRASRASWVSSQVPEARSVTRRVAVADSRRWSSVRREFKFSSASTTLSGSGRLVPSGEVSRFRGWRSPAHRRQRPKWKSFSTVPHC